jgi:hypothetical protein
MPRPPHALAREKARDALAFLSDVCTLDRKNKACPWKLSTEAFAGAPDDGDETPLDRVCYNEARRKYEYKNDDGSSVNEDDFILQAMVMLLLYRLEFGLGKQMAMQQLSVWKGSAKKPTKSTLPNLWEQDLVPSKKQAGHIDNFYAFADCYGRPGSHLESSFRQCPQRATRVCRTVRGAVGFGAHEGQGLY